MDIATTTQRAKHLAERGLTTVEYAIGLLAAAAAALVLLRIFNDNAFFQTLFDWVVNIFNNISSGNGGGGSIFDIFKNMFGI
ncbi:MAG: DUF4244 domain-containing protein [Propionibacteriaceae bacterium]|nr:DUF4244 domain-containing protein [Propionibacteriaceae bacterium]